VTSQDGAPESPVDGPARRAAACEFLRALCPDGPQPYYLVVWGKQGGAEWFSTTEAAVEALLHRNGAGEDAYVGVALQSQELAEQEAKRLGKAAKRSAVRGYSASAAVLPGLYIDIDVATGRHDASHTLPPTVGDALALLGTLPVPPSLVVHTGGGLHVYWLFREPWVLESQLDRDRAARLLKGWESFVRGRFEARGWHLDSVADLARVLRVPGTINHKYGHLVRSDELGARYNPSDFEDYAAIAAPAPSAEVRTAPRISTEVLSVDPSRQPNADLLMVQALNPTFKNTWERQRPDLADQSQSCYDFSLTNLLVQAGCGDQFIVDVCVAHAVKHGGSPKDASEYARNIAKARSQAAAKAMRKQREDQAAGQAHEALEALVDIALAAQAEGAPKAGRTQVFDSLSHLLGVRVTGLRQYDSEPPTLELLLEDGRRITIGKYRDLLKFDNFRTRIAESLQVLLDPINQKQWQAIVRLLLTVVEHVELPEVTAATGKLAAWVADYVREHRPHDDAAAAAERGEPCFKDGRLGIHVASLRRHLKHSADQNVDDVDLCKLLHAEGWTRRNVHYVAGARRKGSQATASAVGPETTRSYWFAPYPWPWPVTRSADGKASSGSTPPPEQGQGLEQWPSAIAVPNEPTGNGLGES